MFPPSPTVLEHPIHLRTQWQGARGKWNAVYAVRQESASPRQLEAWDHLSTLLSKQTSPAERTLSKDLPNFRDETSYLEQRRLVSRAIHVSLVVSP